MKTRVFTEKQKEAVKEILRKNTADLHFHYSIGNKKLPYFNFGFPAMITCKAACKHDCKCTEFCYAYNAEKQYNGTFKAYYENMVLWKRDPEKFELELFMSLTVYVSKCKKSGVKPCCRLNESGDFIDLEFCQMLMRTFKAFPEVQFYGYTKQYIGNYIDMMIDFPCWSFNNVNIMLSADPGYTITESLKTLYKVAYSVDLQTGYNMYVNKKAVHCIGDCSKCKACIYGTDNVFFLIHGCRHHDYIPEKVQSKKRLATDPAIVYYLPKYHRKDNKRFIPSKTNTFQGIRDLYCKHILKDMDYETKTKALLEVYAKYRSGEIVIFSNGILFK